MAAGRWRDLLPILILAVLPALAYAPAWHEGRLLAPGDGVTLHLPLRTEVWRALDRGETPSWNPSAFSGAPLLAAYRPGAFHPLMMVLTPLAPFTAFQLLVVVSLGLCGPLAFLYVRRLGAEPVGALLSGAGFALGPYLVGHLGDTPTLVAAPALVLVLLAGETALARPRATTGVLLALAVALLLLAGSPEAVGAGAILLSAQLVFSWRGREGPKGELSRWRVVLASVAAGATLAAPQLLPTLIALGEAGPATAGFGAGDGLSGAAIGLTGFLAGLITHTPAPLFALAAVPLLVANPALRAAAGITLGLGVLMVWRGQGGLGGAVPLAFDLTLAVLAGLSLSTQWRVRHETEGRRLRLLTAVVAALAVAGLSVITSTTGPLPSELTGPVGLLALALILFLLFGGSRRAVAAHVFLLPLLASFLLQPWGRRAWEGAPTPATLMEGTPTRRAIDRVMGPRRHERTLTVAESWPRELSEDLGWANLATFGERHNTEGYDPLVPASRRVVLDGMREDGTLPRAFLTTDPGRLELLGVRWVQVPTRSLVVRADEEGLGDAVDVILEPPRPKQFSLPFTYATEVRIASFLAGAVDVPQGEIVAECVARLAGGREIRLPIRAGVHTAEWAWDRPDVRPVVRHERPRILKSISTREGFPSHQYLGVLDLPARYALVGLRFRAAPGAPPLWLLRLGLHDGATGRDIGVGLASGYLSDMVRLREAGGTPRVTLFEVRRGVGPAWVVDSLRRLPDAARVSDFLRSPTRLGVDSRREALAVARDVEGVTLPPQSRSSGAVLARAIGGRIVLRAAGPGLLVLAEGWDPGWAVRVDADPGRVLKMNGDRLGVVLPEGTHRVVFRHSARGLDWGVLLALLAGAGLAGALLRERTSRAGSVPV